MGCAGWTPSRSGATTGKAFIELDPPKQAWTADPRGTPGRQRADGLAWRSAEPSPDFFETLRSHTLITGFLADPKYGGNRNFVGWKHVGYPGPSHALGGYSEEQMLGKAPVSGVWERKG